MIVPRKTKLTPEEVLQMMYFTAKKHSGMTPCTSEYFSLQCKIPVSKIIIAVKEYDLLGEDNEIHFSRLEEKAQSL